tara:strand:- start:6071 stop:6829 length:759 start_codon:yes stop_codon:yes gene_type:complete
MPNYRFNNSSARIYNKIRGFSEQDGNWILKWKPVCGSTQIELRNWIKVKPLSSNIFRAVIARRQTFGHGQKGRKWISSPGGIWVSVAIPVVKKDFSSEIFGLSLGVQICKLLKSHNINVELKWPNDVFYKGKKLCGFLPKLITRGNTIIYISLGLGINLNNSTLPYTISISDILGRERVNESYWTARVLRAICLSIEFANDPLEVVKMANKFLIRDLSIYKNIESDWNIKGVNLDGGLIIEKYNNQTKVLYY